MKKLIKTDCIHFDCAQGRNKCYNDKVKSNRCIADCGEFEVKENKSSKRNRFELSESEDEV